MKELTAPPEQTFPWTRLWSDDYTTTLWDSRRDDGTADDYLRASGRNSLPLTVDHSPDDWRTRGSGRLVLHDDGHVEGVDDSAFIEYLMSWPNPAV